MYLGNAPGFPRRVITPLFPVTGSVSIWILNFSHYAHPCPVPSVYSFFNSSGPQGAKILIDRLKLVTVEDIGGFQARI